MSDEDAVDLAKWTLIDACHRLTKAKRAVDIKRGLEDVLDGAAEYEELTTTERTA